MRNLHKFVVLFLLVCLSLQGGISYSAQTGFGGLDIDPSTDDNVTSGTVTVSIKDTSSTNTVTIDGQGNVFQLETGGNINQPDWSFDGFGAFDGSSGTVNFITPSSVMAQSNLRVTSGNFISVFGTTAITNIETTDTWAGRLLVLNFQNTVTVDEGGPGTNLRIASNYSATADDTLTLFCYDGIKWYEVARSGNN